MISKMHHNLLHFTTFDFSYIVDSFTINLNQFNKIFILCSTQHGNSYVNILVRVKKGIVAIKLLERDLQQDSCV